MSSPYNPSYYGAGYAQPVQAHPPQYQQQPQQWPPQNQNQQWPPQQQQQPQQQPQQPQYYQPQQQQPQPQYQPHYAQAVPLQPVYGQNVQQAAIGSTSCACYKCGAAYPLPGGSMSWRCKSCGSMNGTGFGCTIL